MPMPQSGRRPVSDEDRTEREAHYFRLFAGALCFACITFGLLNVMNVIHV
jgi:hypothetical protein